MLHVITFVLCTIQQPLSGVKAQLDDIKVNGGESRFLWGFKRHAYMWHVENAQTTYASAMTIWEQAQDDNEAAEMLLQLFAAMPGLGLVKGGFVVQCCFGLAGCMDTHNLVRLGINPNQYNAGRFKGAKKPETRVRIASDYLAECLHCGGARKLWNDWCDYVADNTAVNGKAYVDGNAVSLAHCEALGIV